MARSSSQQTGVAELALPFSGFLPREAVAQSTDGACTLSDIELVGRTLRHNGGMGAAYIILDEYSSLQAAVSASVGDFTHRTGLDASAHQDLQLAHELGLRMARAGLEEKCILNSWSGLMVYLKSRLAHAKTEQFRVLFLDNKNRLIADEVMGQGTINHAPVYPREVMRRALEHQCAALVLVHNHPSGDPSPSQADIKITAELVAAAKIFAISIHDHIVVGGSETISFRTKGLM